MLRSTTSLLKHQIWRRPKAFKELTNKSWRLAPLPILHEDVRKNPEFKLRFMDVGPSFDRVWLSLGVSFRRRRTGRTQDQNDMRYYWRPIPKKTQTLYLQRFRRLDRSNKFAEPDRIVPENATLMGRRVGPLYSKWRPGIFNQDQAGDKRYDFEYRVF